MIPIISMTPEQKIKKEILLILTQKKYKEYLDEEVMCMFREYNGEFKSKNIDQAYNDTLIENDICWDYEEQFREGQVETNIKIEDYTRYYSSKSVASKMSDNTWVGWTYYYGGGKHGEPETIDWMSSAYNLKCEETQQLVTIRKFTKI